jgi:hypothetical protein
MTGFFCPSTTAGKEKLIAKMVSTLVEEIENRDKVAQTKNMYAHILGIMNRLLGVSEEDRIVFYDLLMEKMDLGLQTCLKNIVNIHGNTIGDYLKRDPEAFSGFDKPLWELILNNHYRMDHHISDKLGINTNQLNLAIHHLIASCTNIYKTIKLIFP